MVSESYSKQLSDIPVSCKALRFDARICLGGACSDTFCLCSELEPQDANRPLPQTSDSITSGFGDDESDVSPPSKSNRTFSIPNTSTFQGRPPAASSSTEFFVDDKHAEDGERQKTRSLVGSLNADGKFKQNGFVKKTMSLCGLHMISCT